MPAYAAPGVYFERVDAAGRGIAAVRTDIAAFVGIAEKGPLHRPVAVRSWQQFQGAFGSFIPNGFLAYAAKAFFENGGQMLYVVRVAAAGAETDACSTAVQPSDGSGSVVDDVAGFAPGALVTIRQEARAATIGAQPPDGVSSQVDTVAGFRAGAVVRATQPGPPPRAGWCRVKAVDEAVKAIRWETALDAKTFDLTKPVGFETVREADFLTASVDRAADTLTWTQPLIPTFDLARPLSFATGAAPAGGILYDEGANPTLEIRAESPGTWGDALTVRVRRSSLAATRTTPRLQPPGRELSFVQSVAGFPRFSLVWIYQPGAGGPVTACRLVEGVDPAANALIWNTPLDGAFDVSKPISFETREFSLGVLQRGTVKEEFAGLSMVPGHPRYVEAVIASSARYLRVTDLRSPAFPASLPDPGALGLVGGALALRGGRDGIAALRPEDFIGDLGGADKRGLRTLEDVDEVSVVAVPDILTGPVPAHAVLPPVLPTPDPCVPAEPAPALPPAPPPTEAAPTFSLDEVFRVQQAASAHCEAMRFRFAVLDTPDFAPAEAQSWRARFDTKFAALYYPWVLVRDPSPQAPGIVRRVPPSGHVAGLYAQTDLAVGVFKASANVPLAWAQGLTTEVSAALQESLNPLGVNCLRAFPGRGIRVYGARTLSSEAPWRFVNVRRLVSMVEKALLVSLQWCVFEPHDLALRHTVRVAIANFLEALWAQGALAGGTPEESFQVRCDETNNLPAATASGQLVAQVGVAAARPAEFVVFRLGRTDETLEVSE